MMYFFKLIRPQQWVKNLFLFIPAFFAGVLFDEKVLFRVGFGFFCFCAISSAVYILNDLMDKEEDAKHPVKKYRPIASGKVSVSMAITALVFLAVISLVGGAFLNIGFGFCLLVYFLINVAYSLKLKHVAIIDVVCVSSGFLIRVISGGLLAGVVVTNWLVIMIFLLSLFLAFSKRRDEVVKSGEQNTNMRSVVSQYNLPFLDSAIVMLSGIIIITYIMYTISDEVVERIGTKDLYYTAFFVLIGVLRYLHLVFVYNMGGSPVRIFYKDKVIPSIVFLWAVAHFVILYFG